MRVIQLSDMHFVRDLSARSSRFKSKAWFAESHDWRTLSALARAVRDLSPDLIVVTGDLSTSGSLPALTLVRRFLSEEVVDTGSGLLESYPRPWKRKKFRLDGLGSPQVLGQGASQLTLPGNHDRYGYGPLGQIQKGKYEKVFPNLPYVYVAEDKAEESWLVLVALDSTWVKSFRGQPFSLRRLAARLAEGRINEEQLAFLANALRGPIYTCSLTGKTYNLSEANDSLATVVAMHHHPILPNVDTSKVVRARWDRIKDATIGSWKAGLCELSNAETVREVIQARSTDLVMFGHQHLSYQLQYGSTLYSCCPASTAFHDTPRKPWRELEVDEEPGFVEYNFGRAGGTYGLQSAVLHRWENLGFIPYAFTYA